MLKGTPGWADLMFRESAAMISTMLDLMNDNVPSLSIHDSLVVPASKQALAVGLLTANYRREAQAIPGLMVHGADGSATPIS